MNENNEQKSEEIYTIQDASLEERLAANNTPVQTAEVDNTATNVVEENGRLNLVVQDDYYYDKAPCDGDLFAIYFIADTFNLLEDKSDLLGALLLTWLKNDKVKMTQKKTLFGKLINVLHFSDYTGFESILESEAYELLSSASKNYELSKKDFDKWANKNKQEINIFFSRVLAHEKERYIGEGLISCKDPNVQATGTTKNEELIFGNQLIESAKQILGFSRYMKNYVQICNSNPDTKWIDAETWRSYLLVAEVLGVTEAVRKTFNEIYKNFDFFYYKSNK